MATATKTAILTLLFYSYYVFTNSFVYVPKNNTNFNETTTQIVNTLNTSITSSDVLIEYSGGNKTTVRNNSKINLEDHFGSGEEKII